jgi:hypothetical protein
MSVKRGRRRISKPSINSETNGVDDGRTIREKSKRKEGAGRSGETATLQRGSTK